MAGPECNTSHQVCQIIEIEIGLEIVLETIKIEIKVQKEDEMARIELEANLEIILVTDLMTDQGYVRKILERNPTNILSTVTQMVIPGNVVGRCWLMKRKQKDLGS